MTHKHRAKWTGDPHSKEWKYVEEGTDRIIGQVDRLYGINEYVAYLRGNPGRGLGSFECLGSFTTERGAKAAVEACAWPLQMEKL